MPRLTPALARFLFAALLMPQTVASTGAVHAQSAAEPAGPPPAGSGTAPVGADLPDMPDIGLDWPDLATPEPPPVPEEPAAAREEPLLPSGEAPIELAEPGQVAPPRLAGRPRPTAAEQAAEAEAQAQALSNIDPGADLAYRVTLSGMEDIADDLFHARFEGLSELAKGEGRKANLAQISRRGKADTDLVEQLLRTRGYYDSRTLFSLRVERPAPPLIGAVLEATPGPLYRLSTVEIMGLSASDAREKPLRDLFAVKEGDPADTDRIIAAADALKIGLAEGGYPFAKVDEPELRIDHDERRADLDLVVAAGGYRRYGRILVQGAKPPFGADHVADIARFHPGEPYNQTEIADLNRALVATSLVSQVSVTPKEGATPETVDILVAMESAPPRTIAGELGYGTGEGARAEVSWQHRNLFPPEGALILRGIVGTNEQSAIATFRRSNFHRRDRALNVELGAANIRQNAYEAQTLGISGSLERLTSLIFQKKWAWSLGAELRLSDERDYYGTSLTPRHRVYIIAALPTSLTYDASDDLLDPSKGFRLGGRLSPEISLQGNVFGYVRAQVDGSAYVPAGDRLVLAGRVRLGTIVGAGRDRIAPTRRFYAGGGASVRGYSYQAIGPRDLNNDPLGGRSLSEVAIEARFRFGGQKQFGIVPFVDAGAISTDPLPSIRDMRVGAGLGFRYYSNFGPIRIDIGTPINPQPGDPRVGVYVSLGQAF